MADAVFEHIVLHNSAISKVIRHFKVIILSTLTSDSSDTAKVTTLGVRGRTSLGCTSGTSSEIGGRPLPG